MRISVQDLVDIRTGFQAREGLQTSPDGTHFIVQVKDINEEDDHALMVDSLDKIVATRDLSPYIIRNGEVLFLARGRRRFATLVEGLSQTSLTIASYYFFILSARTEHLNPAFLCWVINETEAQQYLERIATTTAMPFVTKQSFGALEIDIPPLEIQTEIARLHRLGRRESWLLRQLDKKRSEFVRSACRNLYREKADS